METSGGRAAVETAELRTFASRAAGVGEAVARLSAALRGLQGAGMSVGSGFYASQIVDFYRDLIGNEIAPTVADAVHELDRISATVSAAAAQWDHTEQTNTGGFRP